ncbi:TPA: hypothetical protein ACN35N_003564 [Vibrio parahaemolyticus]
MNNWLVRFSMGLPCRHQDRKEMEEVLPELFQSKVERKSTVTSILPLFWEVLDVEMLTKWAFACEVANDEKELRKATDVCPVCSNPRSSNNNDKNDYLNIEMSGGVNRKSSVPAFMQLVAKNRKTKVKGPIKDVYFTDRFLLADVGEAGIGGGYSHIIEYLENLSIEKESQFTIHMPSWPSKSKIQKERDDCLSSAQIKLKNLISSSFNNVQYAQLPQKPVFHDRLYLVRGSDSQINGVFGPSLNGLASTDIALMGEIEDKGLLNSLDFILSGRNR